MIQTGSMVLIFICAMGIGPALCFAYLFYAMVKAKVKKLLTE